MATYSEYVDADKITDLQMEMQHLQTRLGQQPQQQQQTSQLQWLQDRVQQLTRDNDKLRDKLDKQQHNKEELEEEVMILFCYIN